MQEKEKPGIYFDLLRLLETLTLNALLDIVNALLTHIGKEQAMNSFKIVCMAILLLFGSRALMSNAVQSRQRELETAESLFKAGKFTEAEKLYTKVLAAEPANFQADVRLGSIFLLSNRLDDAQKWLAKAIELKPEEQAPQSLMAEVFYRQDDFKRAAPLFRATGQEAVAKKLESFKGITPYHIEGRAEVSHLKFVITDPLPVIQVRVNEGKPVNFFIDTGGAEVMVDSQLAKELNLVQFGSVTGTFAGGKKAAFQHGRLESLTLGAFTVKNVPVHLMDVRRFSQPVFGGKRVDGIIGTVLLYHFITTLDYSQGELVLRRKTKENLKSLEQEAQAKKCVVIPFWMAGDHYMVAWGTVNKSQPLLFFVDTGLAGGGFTCPESTLKEAGINLQESHAAEGVGGGGKVKVVPFVVEELALGDAKEHNVHGLYTGAFPLENAFGFRIGGLISHGFFRHYALTLDFVGMRYFLERKG